MPLTTEQASLLEETVNRLATETILAQAGRDDGLVPAYSLLSDLRDRCAPEPELLAPVTAIHATLDKMLDAAKPFDEPTLGELRWLVEWLPVATECLKNGQPVPPFGASASAPAQPAAAAEAEPVSTPTAEAAPVAAETATAPAPVAVVPAAPAPAPVAEHAAEDVMLELHFEENKELLGEFYAEAVDHLQQIEAALLALDQQPDNPEALNSIFRSFHTIKGNAGFLGLLPMHTLAHEVESLLDLARNHKLRLSAVIITEILRSRDALSQLTQQVAVALERGQMPDQIVPVGHLIRAVKKLAVPDGTVAAPVAAPAAAALAPVEEFSLAAATPVAAAESAPAAPAPAEAAATSAVSASVPRAQSREAAKVTANALEAAASGKSAVGNQTVRVNTEKLDSLMDVVGELVIVQSQLIETSRQNGGVGSALQRNVAQLSRITKELQHTAMSLRMIPIKPTFQKMERLARDLARDFGKKVTFVTSGEDTDLDRTVVEEIGDPLVHMVRNALDHGLEPTADRAGKGKPESGQLHLCAYHQGSNIVIELQDDGRGIDPDRIYKKAVEKGVIAPNAVMSREEILNLIFAPGFSTAEKVTSVSGRGVGMDVVKRNIDKLRGKIEITSEVGRGSTFKIKLPLTMAIIDGLVVRVGNDRFILPSTSVQRALRPTRESISTLQGHGEVLDLRGKFVPIHSLHARFGLPGEAVQPWDGIVVIVENAGKVSALLVDEMVSKQEVVIKNLGGFMQNLPGVAGAAILGDGSIALILDPGTLLNAA
ncbi:MAG: chemotaxis protein CheA [Verrucomicrobia bacterium]|nr:chemotaxis protein CheA [Verrucomicrobiota bacterium]